MKNIKITGMATSEMQWVKDAIADVLCWHNGYEAAKPDYKAPPGLQRLSDFSYELQTYINSLTEKVEDLPF